MRERKKRHDDAHRPIKVRGGTRRTDAVLVNPHDNPQPRCGCQLRSPADCRKDCLMEGFA